MVTNPDHVEKGVRQILADGKPVDRIPAYRDGVHHVVVILGDKER